MLLCNTTYILSHLSLLNNSFLCKLNNWESVGHFMETKTSIKRQMSITLCTLNTKGLVNKNKSRQLFKNLENKKFDILLLQETHTDKLSCET